MTYKVTGRMSPYLAAGSLLPDLVPFVVHEKNLFEPLHEGGELFLRYLDEKFPDKRDLGIGMLAHGVKYGADKFNRMIDQWLLDGDKVLKEKLALQIMDCSAVSHKVAWEYRVHNYLWAGLDLYLLRGEKDFIEDLIMAHQEIQIKEIADLLSDYLGRGQNEVEGWIDQFFSCYSPMTLTTLPGMVTSWRKVMAGLPERDQIDKKKTTALFEKVEIMFHDQWAKILDQVVTRVKGNLRPFMTI